MKLVFFCVFLSHTLIAQKNELVFATYAYAANSRLENIEPLAAYITDQIGHPVKAVSYSTVQFLINAIVHDSVDFAMLNTSGYLVLKRNFPEKALPLVNLMMGNASKTNYGGCLIANKQTGIQVTADLKGRKERFSLALVSSSSTSGNLVPRLILNRNGIPNAELNFAVSFAGTHKKVVEEVMSGGAAIGGCGCAEIEIARRELDFDSTAFVIESFDNIPLGPIVYNKHLDEKIVRKTIKALTKIDSATSEMFIKFCAGWTEFQQATRFKIVEDSQYDELRKMFGDNPTLWTLIE